MLYSYLDVLMCQIPNMQIFTEEENPAEMENDTWRNVEFESSVLNIRKL